MYRVLKREGTVVRSGIFHAAGRCTEKRGRLFWLGVKGYIRYVLPFGGGGWERERGRLTITCGTPVETFPHPRQIRDEMKEAGFNDVNVYTVFSGRSCFIYGSKIERMSVFNFSSVVQSYALLFLFWGAGPVFYIRSDFQKTQSYQIVDMDSAHVVVALLGG